MTYSSEILADSPALYYKLDEASGTTAADSSGNSRNATAANVTWGQTSLLADGTGTSASFNGTSAYVKCVEGAYMNTSTITVTARIIWDGTTGNHWIASRWTGSAGLDAWLFYVDGSTGKLGIAINESFGLSGATALTSGVTYTVGFRANGSTLQLFLNGVSDASAASGGPTASGADLELARAAYAAYSTMRIDEFAFFTTGLSDARLAAHHAAAIAGGALSGNAALVGTATFGAAAVTTRPAVAALTATSTLGATADGAVSGVATLSTVSTFVAGATLTSIRAGVAAFVATSTMTAAATIPSSVSTPGTVQVATFFSTSGFTTSGGPVVAETMDLVILDPTQERAPTSLDIVLSGADPLEEIVFTIDGVEVWRDAADENGSMFAVSIAIPSRLAGTPLSAGDHVLTATGVRTGTDTFHLNRGVAADPQISPPDIDPVDVTGRNNSWMLQDPRPGGLGSWILHPSPSAMSEPELAKTLTVDHTTSPSDGQYHISVADVGNKQWTWSGYCPDQAFYENLKSYADLNRRIYTFDHRGRAWKSTILRFEATPRKRQIETDGTVNDWAHDYTITAVIYSNEPVPVAPPVVEIVSRSTFGASATVAGGPPAPPSVAMVARATFRAGAAGATTITDWRASPLMMPAANKVIYGMYAGTSTSLNTLESQWSAPIKLTRVYTGNGPILSGLSACQTHLNAGRVPVASVNWKNELKSYVNANLTNVGGTGKTIDRFMADGLFDGNTTDGTVNIAGGPQNVPGFRAIARKIKAFSQGACPTNRIVLTPWHEMENIAESGFGTNKNAQGFIDFRGAWHRLRAVFDAEGVTNVLWGFCGATGPGSWGTSLTDSGSTGFYPGHNYVDWMMWDPYNSSGLINSSGVEIAGRSGNVWLDFGVTGNRGDGSTGNVINHWGQTAWWYNNFKVGGKPTLAEVTGSEGVYKPVVLGETGTGDYDSHNDPTNPAKRASVWFDNMNTWLTANPEMIRGLIYFNNSFNDVECIRYRPVGFPGRGAHSIWATVS